MNLKIVLHLLLCIITSSLFSQNSFFKNIDFSKFVISDFVEKNNVYVMCGTRFINQNNDWDSSIVIKWNPSGDSIVKKFKPTNFIKCSLSYIYEKSDGGYISFGSLNYNLTPADTEALYIVGLDSMLNIQWEVIKKIPDRKCLGVIKTCKYKNNWVGAFNITRTINPNTPNATFTFEVSENGILKKFGLLDSIIGDIEDIMVKPDSTGFYLFGIVKYSQASKHVISLDTALNNMKIKYFYPLNTISDLFYSHIYEGGDTFLLSSRLSYNNNGSYYYIGFSRIKDTDSSLVQTKEWIKLYSYGDETVPTRSITRSSAGKLYFTGNLYGGSIYIESYDNNFNLLFKKTIKRNDTILWCYNTLATTDGGLLLIIGWSSYTNPMVVSGGYFIKFDSTGTITWEKDNKNIIPQSDYIIFPNPVKDIINLNKYSSFNDYNNKKIFELFDENNKLVFSKIIESNNSTFNIENLSSGIYIYKISINNYIKQSGKLIKN